MSPLQLCVYSLLTDVIQDVDFDLMILLFFVASYYLHGLIDILP